MPQTEIKVLVVDDDEFMLKATGRLLRRIRPDWQIFTVSDPKQWLDNVEENDYEPDLVLSDFLMPEIKGDELLLEVKTKFPQTLRALITGDTSSTVPNYAKSCSHFLIPKPFTELDFTSVLESVERLKKMPFSERCRIELAGIEELPVLPNIVKKLRRTLDDSDSTVLDVAELVKTEPALVAKIIQMSNSTYFGFESITYSLEIAINRLGVKVIESLALAMLSNRTYENISELKHDEIVSRYLTYANLSVSFAEQLNIKGEHLQRIYLSCMLSVLGELTLMEMGASEENTHHFISLEQGKSDVFIVASYVLILWGYDMLVAEAVLDISTDEIGEESLSEGIIIRLCIGWVDALAKGDLDNYSNKIGPFYSEHLKAAYENTLR